MTHSIECSSIREIKDFLEHRDIKQPEKHTKLNTRSFLNCNWLDIEISISICSVRLKN